MRFDILSDVMSAIKNGDKSGKSRANTPASKLVKGILLILQKHNYVGDFEYVDDNMGGRFSIQLIGKINNCSAIRPRHYAKVEDYEKFEKRYLPAAGMGFIIVSTSKGLMLHSEAKKNNLGGTLLGYVY
ncbi:MAG: 30S ribosomal protein S8 [Candidatus Aenigmarchaeota archaeon]|nr:30S ribosomal protein S8 [Candidatus Aenigmarchaeota archaeon]